MQRDSEYNTFTTANTDTKAQTQKTQKNTTELIHLASTLTNDKLYFDATKVKM